MQNFNMICDDFINHMKAQCLNTGPFHMIMLSSYVFPLRQIFTLPGFFFWESQLYDIDIYNKG